MKRDRERILRDLGYAMELLNESRSGSQPERIPIRCAVVHELLHALEQLEEPKPEPDSAPQRDRKPEPDAEPGLEAAFKQIDAIGDALVGIRAKARGNTTQLAEIAANAKQGLDLRAREIDNLASVVRDGDFALGDDLTKLSTRLCDVESQLRLALSRLESVAPEAKVACEHPEDTRLQCTYSNEGHDEGLVLCRQCGSWTYDNGAFWNRPRDLIYALRCRAAAEVAPAAKPACAHVKDSVLDSKFYWTMGKRVEIATCRVPQCGAVRLGGDTGNFVSTWFIPEPASEEGADGAAEVKE